MYKCFYYPPAAVGLSEFPPGYFKFDPSLITPTNDPALASCYVLPCDIKRVTDKQLLALPYRKGNERRHVFFSTGEEPKRALPFDALAFRTDHSAFIRAQNPSARSWAWGVEDLARLVPLPADGFKYDIHAQMWASSEMTDAAVESCKRAGLRVHDQRNNFFYGTLETANDPRLAELRRTFLESMSASRLVLVPRSRAGVNRYRFYEAMSCGRVPVLLCDECELPLADKIPYHLFTLRYAEKDVDSLGEGLHRILTRRNKETLQVMGRWARGAWTRWFNPANWERVWAELTIEYLEGLGK